VTIKKLSNEEVAQIRGVLALAREGRATLVQLAAAHDLAIGAVLNGCLGELRDHIRQMVSPPPFRAEGKNIALGIASGILTHYLLRRKGNA